MNFTVINVFRPKKKSTEIREKSGNFFFFNERSPWVALMLGCSGWLRIRLAVQVRAEDLQTEYLQTTTIASFARYGWSRSRQVAGGWTTGTKSRVWDSWGGSERLPTDPSSDTKCSDSPLREARVSSEESRRELGCVGNAMY